MRHDLRNSFETIIMEVSMGVDYLVRKGCIIFENNQPIRESARPQVFFWGTRIESPCQQISLKLDTSINYYAEEMEATNFRDDRFIK